MPLRNEVLDDRRFWAFVFGSVFGQIGEAPDVDAICSLLDVSAVSAEQWVREFTGSHPGIFDTSDGYVDDPSTILLSLANDISLRIEFHPGGCFWQLVGNGGLPAAHLGNIGPHRALPGLRWQEAVKLADIVSSSSAGMRQAILLLLPMVWLTQGDDVDSARRLVESAWSDSGLARGSRSAPLAEVWVRAVADGMKFRWHLTAARGWVTDAHYSTRGEQRPEAEVLTINQRLAAACGVVQDR